MAESEIERRRNRRIDNLYKNLNYVSSAYHQAESTFPFWEAAFALIVGQLVIAYFTIKVCPQQKELLTIGGFIISFIWFILVSLNLKYAQHMNDRIEELQTMLDQELRAETSTTLNRQFSGLIKPWPSKNDKKYKWKLLGNILLGNNPGERLTLNHETVVYLFKSTWFWRRCLPFFSCISWVILFLLAFLYVSWATLFLLILCLSLLVLILILILIRNDIRTDKSS